MTKNREKEKKKKVSDINTIWGGRFSSSPDRLMEAINVSIDFDKRLANQDIRCSTAHVEMLEQRGIVSKREAKSILNGLKKIQLQK